MRQIPLVEVRPAGAHARCARRVACIVHVYAVQQGVRHAELVQGAHEHEAPLTEPPATSQSAATATSLPGSATASAAAESHSSSTATASYSFTAAATATE